MLHILRVAIGQAALPCGCQEEWNALNWLLAGLGPGCGTSWQSDDLDGDGFTAAQGDC